MNSSDEVRFFSVEPPNIVSNNFDGEIIIADYDKGVYYSLIETAADIWLGLRSGRSAGDVAAIIAKLHPSSSEVAETVLSCVGLLTEAGVIRATGAPIERTDWSPAVRPEFLPPQIECFDELKDLLLLDPVHDTAEAGWPRKEEGNG